MCVCVHACAYVCASRIKDVVIHCIMMALDNTSYCRSTHCLFGRYVIIPVNTCVGLDDSAPVSVLYEYLWICIC